MTPPAPPAPLRPVARLDAEGYVDRCKRCRAATVHRRIEDVWGRMWWRCAECDAFRPLLTRHATPWWRSPEVPA